jgi:uncharacterized protein YjbI with pentapeptide repeats
MKSRFYNQQNNYSNQDLKGQSFKGQSLAGFNFDGADIRGANFEEASLNGANLANVKAGLQPSYSFGMTLGAFAVIALFLIVLEFLGLRIGDNLNSKINPGQAWNSIMTVLIILTFLYNIRKSLESAFKWSIYLILFHAVTRYFTGLFLGLNPEYLAKSVNKIIILAGNSIIVGVLFGVVSVVIASATAIVKLVRGIKIRNIVVLISFIFILPKSFILKLSNTSSVSICISLLLSILAIVLGLYLGSKALDEDERYYQIRSIAIFFATRFGTNFRNAILTNANFANSVLENVDFSGSDINRVIWRNSRFLNRARLGNSYLVNRDILKLLTVEEPKGIKLDRQNLVGINLDNTSFEDISFIGADLANASLKNSILFEVNLSHSNLNGVDFSNSDLTGAYIHKAGWTKTTNLDDLHGNYVYMNNPIKGNREANRFPSQGNFEEGQLKTFIQSLIGTIDLYHNKDFDPRAVVIAIDEVRKEIKEDFQIVAIEKATDGQVIIKVKAADYVKSDLLIGSYYPAYQKVLPTLPADKGKMPLEFNQLADPQSEQSIMYSNTSHDGEVKAVNFYQLIMEIHQPKFNNSPVGMYNPKSADSSSQQVTQTNYSTEHKPLVEAVKEIQELLKQLEQSNPTATEIQKIDYLNIAIKPEIKQRVISALQEGGEAVIDEFVLDNKYLKVVKALLKGWSSPAL